jgi:adenylate cyclase
MKVEETGIENFRIPPFDPVMTDYTGSIYIDWRFYTTESEYGQDLLDLQGKTVLVGVTAEGIVPMIPTPQGAKYPHQIQAAALATILSGKSITRPSYASLLEIVLAGLLSLGIILVAYRIHVLWSIVLFAFAASVSVTLPYYFWHASYFLFDWTFPLLLYIIIFSQASFNNFYRQFKLRQQIKKRSGRSCRSYKYVSRQND